MTTPDNFEMTQRIQAAAQAEANGGALPETPVTPEVAPRRRGRPSNADKAARAAQEKIDEAAGKNTEAPKAKAKAKGPKVDLNVTKFARQLQGLHLIAAKITGMPLLMISEGEATALSESIGGVLEHYDLTIDPKTSATLQLLATAAMVYGPRVIQFKQAKAEAIRTRALAPQTGEPTNDVADNPAG